jgi:hypothetical protein
MRNAVAYRFRKVKSDQPVSQAHRNQAEQSQLKELQSGRALRANHSRKAQRIRLSGTSENSVCTDLIALSL